MSENQNPTPLEQSNPQLAEFIKQVVHGTHPTVRFISFGIGGTTLRMKNGSRQEINKVQPNDKCPCNSGKKFKKCCVTTIDKPLICPHCKKRVEVIKDTKDITTCRCYDPNPNKQISGDDTVLS